MADTVYVYIIGPAGDEGSDGPVKVGIARNPQSRIKELQTSSPFALEIVAIFATPNRKMARGIEAAFHSVMAEKRKVGEWFSLSKAGAIFSMVENFRAMFEWVGWSESEIQMGLIKVGIPLPEASRSRLDGLLQ